MTFDDFSRGLTKVLSTVLVIGAGVAINPYKTVVIKIDLADGGMQGAAKSVYGLDNPFATSVAFTCNPVKGGAKFTVTEKEMFSDLSGDQTTFYPKSCQAGFDTLFREKTSLSGLYIMPDHQIIRDQWRNSPANFVVDSAGCKVNGILVSGEDYIDGTGNLDTHWVGKTGKGFDRSGVQVNGFPVSMLPTGSYAAQAKKLCGELQTKKRIAPPRGVLTVFYAYDDPHSVYVGNGSEQDLALRGQKPFSVQVDGKRTVRTIGRAITQMEKESNGEVRVGDMQKLFTTMTGIPVAQM